MSLGEFDLIRQYFTRATTAPGVVLGVGDDAALLQPAAGEQLVVSTDTLVAGRHFPEQAAPYDIGWKSLAVNLSDLAAMGAEPRWCLLALTLPEANPVFLEAFAAGFFALADSAGIALVGGDTTRGPLAITVTVMGVVPAGKALRRDGARVGDAIYVSGTLGDGGLGLALEQGRQAPLAEGEMDAWTRARLHRPTPRLALGLALRGIASAALDVSDGLAQDLGHILARSAVGARIDVEALPLSAALQACDSTQARRWALGGGDDYELCFTVPPAQETAIQALAQNAGVALSRIGSIEAQPGLRICQAGVVLAPEVRGFQHF